MDEWLGVKLVEAMRDYRVHLYATGLDALQQRLTELTCHTDWAQAVSAVLAEANTDDVAIIPEGPYIIPFFASLKAKK